MAPRAKNRHDTDATDTAIQMEEGTVTTTTRINNENNPRAAAGAVAVAAAVPPSSSSSSVFSDDIPPPTPINILPPAKYKLWLMVLFCVYFVDWLATKADYQRFVERTFRLSSNGSLFVVLASAVATLVYGTLDLMVSCLKVQIHDQWYGLEPWLKQDKTQWVHKYHPNFVWQLVALIIATLEDGFDVFSVPSAAPQQTQSAPKQQQQKQQEIFNCRKDSNCDIILKIDCRIKPDKLKEYNTWRESFLELERNSWCRVKHVEAPRSPSRMEEEKTGNSDDDDDDNSDNDSSYLLFVNHLTFQNIDDLNSYMVSAVRARLVQELQPLLVQPRALRLIQSRDLPDAFTDLSYGVGQPVPTRLPKKWKVCWLITVSLWLVILFTNDTLPFYFDHWGLNNVRFPERASALVRVTITTFLNVYVMVPLLTMLFGNWLKRKEDEHEMDRDEPWRTLNDGLTSPWSKALVTLVFYGGCGLAWKLKG